MNIFASKRLNSIFCSEHLILLLIAVVVFVGWWNLFHGFIFDDAYISYRFAENWAGDTGLRWNTGEKPVEGFSNMLYVVLGAAFSKFFSIAPHKSLPIVGWISWWIICIFAFPKLLKTGSKKVDTLSFWVPSICIIGLAPLGFHSFHGLETTLFTLLLITASYLAITSNSTTKIFALVIVSMLTLLARPDAPVFLISLWITLLITGNPEGKRKPIIYGAIVSFSLTVIYLSTKWLYFGYPFPNTFYLKRGNICVGSRYVLQYLEMFSPLIFLALVMVLISWKRLNNRPFLLTIIPAVSFTLPYLQLNPILGIQHRFLIPVFPLYLAAAYMLLKISQKDENQSVNVQFLSFVFALSVCISFCLFNFQMIQKYPSIKNDISMIQTIHEQAGKRLKSAKGLNPVPLIGTGDIGAISYFSELPILDLIGHADEYIAHNGLTYEYLGSKQPDLLILQDLYLTQKPIFESPVTRININNSDMYLDYSQYGSRNFASWHSGAGSTYQVTTFYDFTKDYCLIDEWKYYGKTVFWIFVRHNYSEFKRLSKILLNPL